MLQNSNTLDQYQNSSIIWENLLFTPGCITSMIVFICDDVWIDFTNEIILFISSYIQPENFFPVYMKVDKYESKHIGSWTSIQANIGQAYNKTRTDGRTGII